MRAESRRRGRRWLSLLLTLAMVWTLVSGALAMNVNRSGAQTVTVTMEYTDESGRTMYYLPPTQVELEEGDILVDVLQRGYQDRGSVTYSTLYGFTVTPNDGQAVGEVNWGKKAWWPFVDSVKVGNKYQVQAGGGDLLIFVQGRAPGPPALIPPGAGGGQGAAGGTQD